VPAHFCLLDALPMTTSGKVARSALPPIEACRTLTEGTLEMPTTAEEEMLAEVWGEVLGVAQIGATDNFFELGGDSLRCLQVRTRALRRGYAFSIEQLFAHPTVRQLAQVLERRDASIDELTPRCAPFALVSPEVRRALPADAVDAFPLSKLQEALLYHSQHDPAYEIYLLSLTVRAPLHEQALRDTLSMLAARHPMLQISYDTRSFDALLQIVHRNATIPLAIDDLSTLPADEQERAIDAWIDGERHHHFDWHAAPLLRVRVHRRSTSAFQLTVSHALYDGWSLSSAIVELLGDYLARVAGRPSPLQPPPTIDYREFVLAEQEAIESAECRAFWTRTLADAPAAGLPIATVRGETAAASAPASTPKKERVRRRVPIAAPVTAGLRDLARSAHAPLKSALLAAHLRVVALLTGTRDVTTGLITNGRLEQPDGDRVLGLFLNTVPLRVRFDRESWRDAVRLTFAAEQDLWPHRRFPLAEIRSIAGRTPFDTAFNFINFHVYDQVRGTDGMDIVDWKNPSDLTYFPLCAYFTEDPVSNQLLFYLDYDAALVEPEDAERAVHYYLAALTAAAEHPDAIAADTELLSDRERAEQDRWAVPDRTATTEATATTEWTPIHRLIEATAARQPEAPAVIAADASLTYGQLDHRTNALARRLRAAGVTSETPVAIVVDRTLDLIVAVLAALKSGAAFVPIDSAQPRERLSSIVEDSGLRLAIVDGHAAPGLLGDDVREIAVDAESESDDDITTQPQSPSGGAMREVALDAIAYIMFTSGSTGKPKGVEVTHRGLTNIVQSVSAEVGISSRDRWLAVTSLTFDISLLELLVPLAAGGQVVLATSRGARDGTYLAELIDRAAATIMQATPSMWRLLLEAGWRGREDLRILCGGEALTRSLANDLLTRAALVWNVYGPTETTIWSAFSRVEADGREAVIGRPFANTTLHVLDERGQRVPTGVPGELYIGGAGVARGYRGRPDQTRERFLTVSAANVRHAQPRDRGEAETADVDNAAVRSDGFDASRLYRTGDRVRWRGDGQLEYLGRLDGQIKIRGFRVELAEIEHALKRDADVGDAVVTVRRIASDDVRLVAWVVPADGRTPTAAELKARAARVLPVYMVPAELVLMPAFPLTPNGKADRRALASMQRPDVDVASASSPSLAGSAAASAATASNTVAASATATERIVTRIWQELLTNGAISRDDNLFDMGAHSLLVMRACLRIERECGIALTPVTAFQYPTIAALAAFIDGQTPAVAADDRVMSTRRDRGGAALAPALQRMIQRRQAAWQAEQPAAHAAPEAS
jgi:amino acid adenylation domain-containing protein